jgi:protein phosphatase
MNGPQSWFRWSSSAVSDTGNLRTINEDAYLERPESGLWAVADGMGGHQAGDLASQMVIASLDARPPAQHMGSAVEGLCCGLRETNRRLRQEAQRRGHGVIGSTVAVLLAVQRHCVCLWAGDSRVYLFREGVLRPLTRDHSQVEELVRSGLLNRREAENHPAANIVTRAVGGMDELAIDAQIQELRDGDIYLLCTDGLNKELSDAEIAAALTNSEFGLASRALLDLARERGGRDNITLVVVRFQALYRSPRPKPDET